MDERDWYDTLNDLICGYLNYALDGFYADDLPIENGTVSLPVRSLDERDWSDTFGSLIHDLICGNETTALNNLPDGARNFNSFDDPFHGNGSVGGDLFHRGGDWSGGLGSLIYGG